VPGGQRLEQSLDPGAAAIGEIARLGRTLNAWRAELLAYFDTDGASNGPTEAVNLLVERARRVGHGFRNFNNYRLRLLLLCGVSWHTPTTPRIRSRRPRLVGSSPKSLPRRRRSPYLCFASGISPVLVYVTTCRQFRALKET
jgi:hypothetical protein